MPTITITVEPGGTATAITKTFNITQGDFTRLTKIYKDRRPIMPGPPGDEPPTPPTTEEAVTTWIENFMQQTRQEVISTERNQASVPDFKFETPTE